MATASVHTDLTALEGLVPQWRQLVQRTPGATVFQRPEWAMSWLGAWAKNSVPLGIALREGDRLVGFAPLYIESIWGVRVARFMGGELNDFNCLLAEPAFLDTFRTIVTRTLQDRRAEWDAIALNGLEHGDLWSIPISGSYGHTGVLRLASDALPTIALPATWEAYLANLSKHRRKRIHHLQRLAELGGQVTFQMLTEPRDMAESLDIFFAARMENWRARNQLKRMVAIQRSALYWTTLKKMCLELSARGCVWLGRLNVNDTAVSWDLAFVTNGIVTDYMTTYDLRYARCSPGQIVLTHMIRHAIEQRMSRFVMGRGAQPYKFWHGARPRATENLILYANCPRGQAYVGVRAVRERAAQAARFLMAHRDKQG